MTLPFDFHLQSCLSPHLAGAGLGPLPFICSGGINLPGIKVLPYGQNAWGAPFGAAGRQASARSDPKGGCAP